MHCMSKYQTVREWEAGSDIILHLLPNPNLFPKVKGEEMKLGGGTLVDIHRRQTLL